MGSDLKPPDTSSQERKSGMSSPQVVRGTGPGARNAERFYHIRHQAYLALLVFIVAVGIPIIGIPGLRHRLQDRVQILREAGTGVVHRPVTIGVGENRDSFPSEYEHPFVLPRPPNTPPVAVYTSKQTFTVGTSTNTPVSPRRKTTIPIPRSAEETAESNASVSDQNAASDSTEAEALPLYLRGNIEKEAYELLLNANATVAGMVSGGNPSLRFQTWEAAKRGDESFWVRLTFTKVSDSGKVEYIWQVKPQSKEVIPLSSNARSLPKS